MQKWVKKRHAAVPFVNYFVAARLNKEGRIDIQPVLNPISFEKPMIPT
ncbi:MAG: hypothetical protein RL172_3244 [Bacteroidota bacterium]|jgi:hypothetical protein